MKRGTSWWSLRRKELKYGIYFPRKKERKMKELREYINKNLVFFDKNKLL